MEFFVEQTNFPSTEKEQQKNAIATVPVSELLLNTYSRDSDIRKRALSNSNLNIEIKNFKILYRLTMNDYFPLVRFYCDFAIDFSTPYAASQALFDHMKSEVILQIGKNIPDIVNSDMNAYAFGVFQGSEKIHETVLINDKPTDITGISIAYHKMLRSRYRPYIRNKCVPVIQSCIKKRNIEEKTFDERKYHILFILVNGQCRDWLKTEKLLQDISSLPLRIFICQAQLPPVSLHTDFAEYYDIKGSFPNGLLTTDNIESGFEYHFLNKIYTLQNRKITTSMSSF